MVKRRDIYDAAPQEPTAAPATGLHCLQCFMLPWRCSEASASDVSLASRLLNCYFNLSQSDEYLINKQYSAGRAAHDGICCVLKPCKSIKAKLSRS